MIKLVAVCFVFLIAANAFRSTVISRSHAEWTQIEVNNEVPEKGLVPDYQHVAVSKDNSFFAFR